MIPQNQSATPLDAWCIARLTAGKTHDQPIGRVSASVRTLVQQLADAPLESRAQVWEDFTSGLPEEVAVDLLSAVVAVNPDDPAPEDDGWETPRLEKPVHVNPFPVEIYPEPVERLVRQGAKAIGCPADFLGMTVLAVAGAAIGRSVSLRIKDGYFASSAFYIANVGKPGDGKSPAMSEVVLPLWRIDEEEHKKFKEAMAEYERGREAFEEAKKNARRVNQATKCRRRSDDGDDLDDDDEVAEAADPAPASVQPIRPILSRGVIDDFTTESLAPLLTDNPRGLLVTKDELSGLMGSLNQYRSGKGADRQILLSVWSGQPFIVDRKGNIDGIPIRVPHPFLGIVGGVQPELLGELNESKNRNDGFVDRILFAYPDPVPKGGWTDDGVPNETKVDWAEIVKRLWERPLIPTEGRLCPFVVKFTPEAKVLWRGWFNSHHDEQNADDFPDWLRGPWAKFDQYAARIALTLHMLRWSADPMRSEAVIPDVGAESMRDAVRLVDYLKHQTRRVRSIMNVAEKGNDGGEYVQTILRWIRRNRLESFSERDLIRNFPRFSDRAKDCHAALEWLVQRHCLRQRPEQARPNGRRGRKPSPNYDVNPRLIAALEGRTTLPRLDDSTRASAIVKIVNSASEERSWDGKEGSDVCPPF
jgi:hypothetical protein